MLMRVTNLLSLGGLALVSGLAYLSGCSGGPNIAPVKGQVTHNGKPVAKASVTVAPEPRSDEDKNPGKAGTGFTDEDGVFRLSTYQLYGGADIGKHKVTISVDDG